MSASGQMPVTATKLPFRVAEHVDQFQRRVRQEALASAAADYWLRRAAMFEWAKGTLEDYTGEAPVQERRARWYELDSIARACRNAATMALVERWAPEECCRITAEEAAELERLHRAFTHLDQEVA